MYVVKYIQGGAAGRDALQALPLVALNGEQMAMGILTALEPTLIQIPMLRTVAASTVKRLVDTEVRFVAGVRDEKALARFCDRQNDQAQEFMQFVATMLWQILSALPGQSGSRGGLTWNVSIVNLITDVPALLQQLTTGIVARNFDSGHLMLGGASASVVVTNLLRASNLSSEEAGKRPKNVVWPKDSPLSSFDLVDAYFVGTPIATLLLHGVQINIAKRLVRGR